MRVEDLLSEKRTAIVSRWRRLIVETYPDSTGQFLERESDRFQNPIGSTLAKETEFLYDVLLRPWNRESRPAAGRSRQASANLLPQFLIS